MTLDLAAISGRVQDMAEAVKLEREPERFQALDAAFRAAESSSIMRRLETAKTSWLLARTTADLRATIPVSTHLDDYTIVASDGSFILPDRHTPAHFYVINIGKVVLRYGAAPASEITADARMYFEEDELYVPESVKRIPVTGTILGLKRAVDELRAARDVARAQPRPALALQDGTLILWSLESQHDDVVTWILDSYMETMTAFRDENVPVAAFISFPGSSDVMNTLRVSVCDYPDQGRAVNCDHCRGRIPEGHTPACDILPNVADRVLFERLAGLQPGDRSQVFGSTSKILDRYGDDFRIHFFYMHTGTEIARVEIPRWLAADRELLDFTHAAIYEQCQLGRGYPSALQEAHEMAAIRPDERRAVEALVEDALARHDLIQRHSAKLESKRGRFI